MAEAGAGDVGMMAPVGPFSPFVSASFLNLQASAEEKQREEMERIVNRVDSIMQEAVQDPLEHARLGAELREADAAWRSNLLRMRHADDFQTRELYQFTEAHLGHLGLSVALVEALAAWQADVLEALGTRSSSLPPAPVDPQGETSLQLRGVLDSVRLGGSHVLTLDLTPSGKAGSSVVVQEELQALERDHAALIDFGRGYGAFDQAGKLLFLDQVERLGDRWEVYLARFRLMGASAPGSVGNTEALLKRLGLTAALAKELVAKAHQAMRREAESEANAR